MIYYPSVSKTETEKAIISKDEFKAVCAFMIYFGLTASPKTRALKTIKILIWLGMQQKENPELLKQVLDLITLMLDDKDFGVSLKALEKIIQ
jgi:hypothetical protein